MKMTKPGKIIELTNSAQISAWRQRLDVMQTRPLILSFRLKPRYLSQSMASRSRNCKTNSIARTPTCTTSRKKMSRNVRCLKNPRALTSLMTWHAGTPSPSTARSANTKASGASTEKSEKTSRKSSVPHSPRKFHNLSPIGSELIEYSPNFYSTQNYGWRENYDNFNLQNSRVAVCKRTFHNPGHLS